MNGKEQITINQLSKKVTAHIELSERRSVEIISFMKAVDPILKSYHDKKVINDFLRGRWKVFVGILTVLAIIGSIVGALLTVFKR